LVLTGSFHYLGAILDDLDKAALLAISLEFDDTSQLNWTFTNIYCSEYSRIICDSTGKVEQLYGL